MSTEEERRRNEISMFAAMALGDDWDPASNSAVANQNNQQHQDEKKPPAAASPSLLNTAAAVSSSSEAVDSGGDSSVSSKSNNKRNLLRRRQQQRRERNNNKDEEEEAPQQQQQRRMGGLRKATPKPTNTTTNTKQAAAATTTTTANTQEQPQKENSSNQFSSGSGTFAFDNLKPVTSMEKSNLEAALAALEKDDNRKNAAGGNTMNKNNTMAAAHAWMAGGLAAAAAAANGAHPPRAPNAGGGVASSSTPQPFVRAPEDTAPMFAEQVFLPRPLFFGPLVPPRVVRQARQMVLDAVAAKQDAAAAAAANSKNKIGPEALLSPTCLEELPGSVRNLVGALRIYGYGINVLHELKDAEDGEFWRGSPYLSTYQPLWGERERAQRIQQIEAQQQKQRKKAKSNRPSIVARSVTAPSRLLPINNSHDEDDHTEKDHGMVVVDLDETDENDDDTDDDDDDDDSLLHEGKSDTPDYSLYPHYLISPPPGDSMPGGLGGSGYSLSLSQTNSSSSQSWSPLHQTQSSQSSTYTSTNSNQNTHNTNPHHTDNEQFTAWIRGDDDVPGTTATASSSFLSPRADIGGSFIAGSGASSNFGTNPSLDSWLRQGQATATTSATTVTANDSIDFSESIGSINNNTNNNNKKKGPLTEQELFSQWALGDGGGTFTAPASSSTGAVVGDGGGTSGPSGSTQSSSTSSTVLGEHHTAGQSTSSNGGANAAEFSGTFRRRPPPRSSGMADSDDDSVEHDERKKQVGLNDHLSKALASLSGEGAGQQPSIDIDESSQQILLSQLAYAARGGGRPFTNYELTNGCVPVYGVDDPPLPVEGDLGIHETKEEQQRFHEQKRAQEIVEKFVKPNVFATVACPNPALGPDDFHSWNARVVGNQRLAPVPTTATSTSTTNAPPTTAAATSTGPVTDNLSSIPSTQQPPPPSQQQSPQTQQQLQQPQGSQSPQQQLQKQTSLSPQQQQSPPPSTHKQAQDHHPLASHAVSEASSGKHTSQHSQSGLQSRLSDLSPSSEHGRPPRASSSFSSPHKKSSNKRKFTSKTRYGWWNVGDPEEWPSTVLKASDKHGHDDDSSQKTASSGVKPAVNADTANLPNRLHLPPLQHSATVLQTVTQLEPTPGSLRKDNLPLSHMHAATSMAQSLPYLSDRSPSHRYIQIDTQAVGFPPIGGEIEPLFCSLGIYNIETITSSTGASSNNSERSGTSTAPLPDLQRCGRVTEVLNFDVFSDKDVGKRCESALWPYEPTSPFAKVLNVPDQIDIDPSAGRRVGTRCGVFPLPSNLNFANLFAVLLVKKVLSEDPLDIYLKQDGGPTASKPLDLGKIRANAEKAAQRQSAFLVPFAFGVAPLLQVFGGAETPASPTSRAVQIPLFRFSPGQGDRQIIDHIMVMLSPREQRAPGSAGTPVAATNGGTAMLVMRNFGYLGLHQVVSASSLGRDRLVDFSGELQFRRKPDYKEDKQMRKPKKNGCTTTLPDWRPDIIAEPVDEGGRYLDGSNDSTGPEHSHRYAQELSPVRLQLSPSMRMTPPTQQGVSRGRMNGQDIEPFYHTCFCNEMLLQPRLLHNCPKGNVVIKAELREVEWNENLAAYFAHLPRCGPSFHNNRRGPFLVQSVLSSCSPRGSDKHFMDEFKLKLPLDLRPPPKSRSVRTFCLVFTIYHVKMSSKSKWKRAKKILTGNDNQSGGELSASRVDQIAAGFFPISRNGGCLVDDGIHDVRIVYSAQHPAAHLVESGMAEETSLVLVERIEGAEGNSTAGRDHSFAEDTTDGGSAAPVSDDSTNASDFISNADDSVSKSRVTGEPITLSVRICANSSLHTQNAVLSDYLHEEEDSQKPSDLNKHGFLSKISLGKGLLLEESASRVYSEAEDRLLRSTLDVVKYNICPVTRHHCFLLRAMTRLWRTLILGTGEASLAWANPATPIPLRLHAFASILQLLGGSSLYLTKNGLTQADGTKWSIVCLGRVIALFFDEQNLFGGSAAEVFHPSFLLPASSEEKKTGEKSNGKNESAAVRRKRHVRNNFDLLDTHGFKSSPENGSPSSTGSPTHGRRLSDIPSHPFDGFDTANEPTGFLTALSRKELKVDSKSDFQSALRAATAAEDDFDRPESDGSKTANAMIQAFAGSSSGSRRWMTAPTRALSTIREQEDTDTEEPVSSLKDAQADVAGAGVPPSPEAMVGLDAEIVRNPPKKTVKQMRIPRARKSSASFDFSIMEEEPAPSEAPIDTSPPKPQSVPKSDDEIESAGTAFLDVIGKSIGVSAGQRRMASEEQRVGSSHHRKTRSRSSIDWTLIGIGDGFAPAAVEETDEAAKDLSIDKNEHLSTLKNEGTKSIALPDFADRLISLERQSAYNARWFPFGYEVIILQWAAILGEQRASGERVRPERGWKAERAGETPAEGVSANEGVALAASRSVAVAIAGAPLLFEVIKDSLGFRITTIFREGLERGATWTSPPLVVLDDTLVLGLEQVITMVADACMDSRNFDNWDLRQMSIDVNDSIIRFLRDMFSFLAPKIVHRLVLSYLSRFVTKEGKHWQDRDSGIGLRCSWEITKLRLNAISGLVRFPEYIRVNGPQMLNWSNWWSPSLSRSDSFFDAILEKYRRFRLPAFVGTEGSMQHFNVEIPAMQPHWLSEIIVDVCLLGTEHAEPQIQQRSASLLHEMFWVSSQEGTLTGQTVPIASMHIAFIWKVLSRCDYLSNFAPKSQLRKDLLPCIVYVLQSAHPNLLRALWRKLCRGLRSKGSSNKFGGFSSVRGGPFVDEQPSRVPRSAVEMKEDPDVLDMFTLLNLSLRTLEYEGSEEHLEKDGTGASRENVQLWQKEFLPAASQLDALSRRKIEETEKPADSTNSSTISRRWSGHDGSLVIVNAGHQMVWELYRMLSGSVEGGSLLNPAVQIAKTPTKNSHAFSHLDIAVFVRAASSLYLHALALRQSDIVVVRTFKVSAELIKIFGIKTFLEGVGETLQHWMRVISLQCGARRAYVRIEATDFLELILRSTWQCYGSFFRIRVPLLAVQTEVMERIVATAAARYFRDQRRMRAEFESFTNVSAEASLVPLWRTLDRMEKQPASQNIAFRGALIRMAEKLKKLYRAYIAARVLTFIQGSRGQELMDDDRRPTRDHATEALVRANRISILRVINASEGHSKQFLGFYATTQQRSRVAHFEAVEDALINAADVFSPTELPEHRVAWLRMLAGFHASRRKFAEEATCHFNIHVTLQQAARLHGSLWSNTPFLPWTDNIPDPVYIDGDNGETPDTDYGSDFDFDEHGSQYGHPIHSFRRIFYRVANSVALNANEWDTAANQALFCGIASALEYTSVSPWATLRDMEEQMVEEAERAGDLFLKAGIIESSRYALNLATQFYAQKFNYRKLAITYRNLERTVVSKVPPIDASLPQEFSATLGRFYRVWFHGGAPDELSGVEFVYRTEGSIRLDTFGQELRAVIKSIIPDNTPIHLVLDGRSEERLEEGATNNFGFNRLGPGPLEPVRIKVTPLRSLFDTNSKLRGLPEWFHRYVDEAFESLHHRSKSELGRGSARGKGSPSHASDGLDPHHREHMRSFSASIFSSGGSGSGFNLGRRSVDDRGTRFTSLEVNELSGVDKFCFVQPKDRSRSKDWWRNAGGDYADKTLKVTQLQVAQSFPACVARQPVVHRLVYTQSPLEAGIDSVCQWCAVLFRTAVATVGMAVLGTNNDPGIGTDAVKIVADSIHSSHVKEIGLTLMRKSSDSREGDATNDLSLESYDRLSDDEIRKLQMKLARLIIVFIELLHLLIARNRQMLLDFMQERKRIESNVISSSARPSVRAPSVSTADQKSRVHRPGSSGSQDFATPLMPIPARDQRGGPVPVDPRSHKREGSLSDYMNYKRLNHQRSQSEDQQSASSTTAASIGRGESAIAVQSELQRALINMVKTLYPKLQGILQGDTPRWLKLCAQDTYFSLGTYKQTQIPIEEELCYTAESLAPPGSSLGEPLPYDRNTGSSVPSPRGSINGGSSHSVLSRGSDRYGHGLV
ncbi:hypothetical protein ACA910_006028 [Epithemia clementina (nom. ined.)]